MEMATENRWYFTHIDPNRSSNSLVFKAWAVMLGFNSKESSVRELKILLCEQRKKNERTEDREKRQKGSLLKQAPNIPTNKKDSIQTIQNPPHPPNIHNNHNPPHPPNNHNPPHPPNNHNHNNHNNNHNNHNHAPATHVPPDCR